MGCVETVLASFKPQTEHATRGELKHIHLSHWLSNPGFLEHQVRPLSISNLGVLVGFCRDIDLISGIPWNYRYEMLSLQICNSFQESEMRNTPISGTLEGWQIL